MAIPTTIITSTSPIPMPSFTKQQTNFRNDGKNRNCWLSDDNQSVALTLHLQPGPGHLLLIAPGVDCLQLDQALLHSVPGQALVQDQDPQQLLHAVHGSAPIM